MMPLQRQIRSLNDLIVVAKQCKQVLTLFSGGLDSTYVLKYLANSGCRVTALSINLGDGTNYDDLERITKHFGAKLAVIDGRQTFANDALLPAIRANARYMGVYPVSSSLSRPIVARYAIELAAQLGCEAIVHTANQSQNSLRRLNGAICQLGFEGYFGTPYEYSAISREDKIKELKQLGLAQFQARGVSGDANLWCREFESGSLENPESFHVPESLFEWTAPCDTSKLAPDLSITFRAGKPIALNDVRLPPVDLIARLNGLAGAFGIGRYSGLEHLEQGEKVLEVREAPAATLLMDAYRHLETATLDAELLREKLGLEQIWVREALEGRWFGHLREAVDCFISETANHVTGTVHYKLRAGAADVCAIRAQAPLYLTDRDNWEKRVAKLRAARSLSIAHHEPPGTALRSLSESI